MGTADERVPQGFPADAPGCHATGSRFPYNVLAAFAPLSTVPSFRRFCGLARGFLAQTGRRAVCRLGPRPHAGVSSAAESNEDRRPAGAAAGQPRHLGIPLGDAPVPRLPGQSCLPGTGAIKLTVADGLTAAYAQNLWNGA